MSNFLLSPPSSFPLLWCTTSSWLGKCLASTNSLVMTSTSTHCILDSLPQNPNKLVDSKPICGAMQREDSGHLMMDSKYVVGSKYWRVQCDLWVTTKEGNVKEVPGGGIWRWWCGDVEEVVLGRWDGLQPLVLWHQSFAMHVCFPLLLNLHVAHCVIRALSGHKFWPWPHTTLIALQQVFLVRPLCLGG